MKRLLLLLCPLLFLSTVSYGALCTNAGLDDYLAAAFSCEIGDLLFSDFNYLPPANTPVDASSIGVTPSGSGFLFNGPWGVSGSEEMDFILGFRVTATKGVITGSQLRIGDPGGTVGAGAIRVTEQQCLNGTFGATGACSSGTEASLFAAVTPVTFQPFDEVTYASGATSVEVIKDIQLRANGGEAAFSLLYNTFTPDENGGGGPGAIPEPSTMVMLGTGMLVTAVALRRRRVSP
jgi:hypothetical protein